MVFLLASCSTTKKTTGKRRDVQVVKSDEKPPVVKNAPKADTLALTKNNEVPPIQSPPVGEQDLDAADTKKENYQVSLYIPLNASAYVEGNNSEERFIQYLAGVRLACDQLQENGINLNLNIIDSENKNGPPFDIGEETDAVIGPYDENRLKTVIELCREKQIPAISPWYSLSKVSDNPYYIQLRPTLKDHFSSMVKSISEHFQPEEVVLVGRNSKTDRAWFKFLQDAAGNYYHNENERTFTEHFVLDDSLALGEWVFGDLIEKGKKVFVVPNYSFKDENYIYSVLRRLNAEKNMHQLVVYGMPIMLDSDRIDFDYYNSLNMRLVVSEFVDESDSDVAAFGRKFYDTYATIPEKDAYEGYDMMMFVGNALYNYGKDFQYKIKKDNSKYLQTSYDIEPIYKDDSFDKIDFFENKDLTIIEFKRGRFVRMK